ncbi:hypothetical protein GCK72_002927 [Caenorhabditis remanei]|uniref:Uncharacterized protein n=1 Tax=Caenorhabditis remanei TaxID=31234 RepID=A0A6A5HY60_CAERE|nr:hypothetical protein GCK72_002927 [Caenorhabditis remanei]KAF1771102.1 hypothetical protein GCK72_002927 [Caenorhabditis remanei]
MSDFFIALILWIHFSSSLQLVIFTKTEPAYRFNESNLPVETNFYGNFYGYDQSGKPLMRTFYKFEETIVDDSQRLYVANDDCYFEVVAPEDMLMHCQFRLYRVKEKTVSIVHQPIEKFTFDHVQRLIYVLRGGDVIRLSHNSSKAMWKVNNVRDFNVVDGILTVLHENGIIATENATLASVDPRNFKRLPIFAAPDYIYKPEKIEVTIGTDSETDQFFIYIIIVIAVSIIVFVCETLSWQIKKRRKLYRTEATSRLIV